MRPCLPALCAAPVLPTYPLAAVDQIVTLGDSLSFAYEVEFGFEVEILGGLLGKSPSEIDMPFTPFAINPTPGPDGLARAILPLDQTRAFLRLEATITP